MVDTSFCLDCTAVVADVLSAVVAGDSIVDYEVVDGDSSVAAPYGLA